MARVDLKHDRSGGLLLVRTAFAEKPGPDDAARATWPTRSVVAGLAEELRTTATWLGASSVVVEDDACGDLPRLLRAELAEVQPRRLDAYDGEQVCARTVRPTPSNGADFSNRE